MKTLGFILFAIFTLFVQAQNPIINMGRGLYYFIPNTIHYDSILFNLKLGNDIVKEKEKFYITTIDSVIELNFQNKKNKITNTYRYPIKKPVLTGMYFGKTEYGGYIEASQLNIEDTLRLEFDVDSFLGKNWYSISKATEILLNRNDYYECDYKNKRPNLFSVIKKDTIHLRMNYYLSKISIRNPSGREVETKMGFYLNINALSDTNIIDYYIDYNHNPIYFLSTGLVNEMEIEYTAIRLHNNELPYPIAINDFAELDSIYRNGIKSTKYSVEYLNYQGNIHYLAAKYLLDTSEQKLITFKDGEEKSITNSTGNKLTHKSIIGEGYSIEYSFSQKNEYFNMANKYLIENKNLGNINDIIFEDLGLFINSKITLDSITIKQSNSAIATIPISIKKYNKCGIIDCTDFYNYTTVFIPDTYTILNKIQFDNLNQLLEKKR